LRNTLRPVNWMPPEILSCITQGIFDDFDKDARSIIPLTHVCQYWRESIVSAPGNWTKLSNNQKDLAALSLGRAKAVPLEIHLSMREIREDPQFLDLLVPYAEYAGTLRVGGLLAVKDLARLPLQSTSNLRSLSLSDEGVGKWDRSVDPFESSVRTLGYLSLVGVPLYPSLLNLKTLTELAIYDPQRNLHLDTLLDFLEENHSLARVTIRIRFIEPTLRSSRRRAAIRNQIHHLRIDCFDAMDGRALISSITLSKGTELEVNCWGDYGIRVEVNDILSGISTTHLVSPTFMGYDAGATTTIRLLGPNGTTSFTGDSNLNIPFAEFPQLPLTNIRWFHLNTDGWELDQPPGPEPFHHLSSFPALETFTIGCKTNLSHILSPLLSNPSASPSLKTLGFQDCVLTEDFMEELMRFASDRKNTSSAWLHHVVIVHWEGKFPNVASIHKLKEHVPVVDVRIATELPDQTSSVW